MPLRYNYGSADPMEYQRNPYADSFNGRQGSMAPRAVANQNTRPRASGNAYDAFRQSGMEWGAPPQQPPPTPASPQIDPAALRGILAPQPQNRDVFNGGDVGGPSSPPPQAPATASPGGQTFFPGGHHGGGTPITPYSPAPTMPTNPGDISTIKPSDVPQTNPATGRNYGRPNPGNVDPALWNTVDRWVQAGGPEYSYLYDHPELVQKFREWQQSSGAQSVDPVDWLKAQGLASPLAGRSGSDTYAAWSAHQGTPPTPTTPTSPNVPPPPAPPPAPTPPTPPNTTPPPTATDPSNWKDVAYPTIPDDATLANILRAQYNPVYQQGQQDLAGILRGQAALTGDSNSGGFGDVLGREEGRLINEQNADFGNKLMTTRENALNRAQQRYATDVEANTQKYGVDAQKFNSLLDADTKRYGIKTNADLERYLGDQSTGMQKYGIDSGILRDYYVEQLRLKGEMYGVDKGFDAAALRAATDKYIADLNRKSQEEQNNLGWGQLNVNRYGIDSAQQIAFMQALQNSGLSPEQLATILRGFTPGTVYVPPGG